MKNVFDSEDVKDLLHVIHNNSKRMREHDVFELIQTVEDLRIFMSWHVFAVWDFMSLVKRLQYEYTCVTLPWIPPRKAQASRLINEIVLGEESDETPEGSHCSHFELYLKSMEEIGASTHQISNFYQLVAGNMPVDQALKAVDAPEAVQTFVNSTIHLALKGNVEEVLGSFIYGREDAIPEMFQYLLDSWSIDKDKAPSFIFYLERHIQLDADTHGPAAHQMMQDQVGENKEALIRLLNAALEAVKQRISLWDNLAIELSNQTQTLSSLQDEVLAG